MIFLNLGLWTRAREASLLFAPRNTTAAARSDNPLVFSAKWRRKKEYAIANTCQVSQWAGWHTKLDRVAITRDHRRRPAVPVQFASLERIPVLIQRSATARPYARPHSSHLYYIVGRPLIEAVGDFSAARHFANYARLSERRARTNGSVISARHRRSPISRTSFAILRTGRVPFAAGESSEDMRRPCLAGRANSHCSKAFPSVGHTQS